MIYSYCIPVDDGAAPNPYWDVCTLTICKPVIRRTADIDDWIVATGSKNSPIGDISKKVVYMMKITDKIPLLDYDKYCSIHIPGKIPDINNPDTRRHVGDCIYYSIDNQLRIRPGVHGKSNITTDLNGVNALLSDHFYYFGDNPIDLKEDLHPIIKNGQGHRSRSNIPFEEMFINWVKELNLTPNKLYGNPQIKIDFINRRTDIVKYSEEDLLNCLKDEEECFKGIC